MLTVHRLAPGGSDYYLADLAREVPVDDPGARGAWRGGAATGLGLRGPVGAEELRAVLDGRHPATGRRLRSDRAGIVGYDLTFSAPKSASVLFALGGEGVARQVLAAHRAATTGALRYVEQHALTARRASGAARHVIPTSGLVAGSFTHGVNRNLDPHLHTHVVAANLVHGDDGRWSACDQRGLWAHRRAAGAVYDAHLRADLTARLGLEWVGGPGSRAEVRGMSPLLLGEFSSRAADVRRHRAQWGAHSARGTQVAWAATRPAKTAGVAFADLVGQWERRSEALGQGRDDRSALVGRAAVTRPTLDEHRFRAVLSATSDGAARRRDVVEALAVAAVGGAPSPALERLVDLWVPAGPEVGVAERALAPRRVVPGDHLLAALGPRPVDPGDHEVWRAGALAIDAYRRRWGVAADRDVPGVAPEPGLASLPAPRLADHVRTARAVELVRQRLGWREPHRVELERGR